MIFTVHARLSDGTVRAWEVDRCRNVQQALDIVKCQPKVLSVMCDVQGKPEPGFDDLVIETQETKEPA